MEKVPGYHDEVYPFFEGLVVGLFEGLDVEFSQSEVSPCSYVAVGDMGEPRYLRRPHEAYSL